MTSKKGLSEAEKRTRMSEIFLSGEFYTFKEIEKIATQQKKIVLQSVKEVLQSLVDDRLVSSDKIGTSVYYWSFPSDAKRSRQIKLGELNKEFQTLQQRKEELENSIQEESTGRQDSEERDALIVALQEKEQTKQAKQRELDACMDSDPQILEDKACLVSIFRDAASRVTDNIWILRSHFINEMHYPRDEVNVQFSICEDDLDEAI